MYLRVGYVLSINLNDLKIIKKLRNGLIKFIFGHPTVFIECLTRFVFHLNVFLPSQIKPFYYYSYFINTQGVYFYLFTNP